MIFIMNSPFVSEAEAVGFVVGGSVVAAVGGSVVAAVGGSVVAAVGFVVDAD
jgi:hypothetical protein